MIRRLSFASVQSSLLIGVLGWWLIAGGGETFSPSASHQQEDVQELKLRQAQLNLELAETEWQQAQAHNSELEASIPATLSNEERQQFLALRRISPIVLRRLESNVELAREQVEQARSPSSGYPEQLRRRYAEEKIRLAEVRLASLKASRERRVEVDDLTYRRAQLQLELARLQLQLLDHPEDFVTMIDHLQRQVEGIQEALVRHDQRLTALETE